MREETAAATGLELRRTDLISQDAWEHGEADVRRIVGPYVSFVHGLAHDVKGAELLRGQWGGRLDRSLLVRTARDLAGRLVGTR